MAESNQEGARMSEDEMMTHLKNALDRMTETVRIYHFKAGDPGNMFDGLAEKTLATFGGLAKKLSVETLALDDPRAAEWGVERAPTLVFSPDRYRIKWLGAPVGEEGRTLVEMLFILGFGQSGLSDQSTKMLEKLDGERAVKVFVSPTCPYCPQQAINAVRAAVARPDAVSVELIDIQANPDLADRYEAQSVPMSFADDALIGMGAQSEEIFIQSMIAFEEKRVFIPDIEGERIETDLLIVGGGPAGLTAAIYAKRAGLETALVEKGMLGGQVATTPVVENYPGFTSVGGKALVDIMVTHAMEYARIFQGEEVVAIKPGTPIEVTTSRRVFTAKSLLLATGATHRRLGAPGEERLSGRGVSYCATCDGPLFKGRRVIMVGGGNSAVTEALYLFHMGVDVTLAHRRDTLRAQEYLVKSLTDNAIPVLWNSRVSEIRGKERVESALIEDTRTGKTRTMATDGVFIAIGYSPTTDLAEKIGVTLTPEGYIQRDARHRTNIPGIYSAGDAEGGYKQIVTAAGQGAEAAMSIFEDLINPYWKRARK